MAEFTVFPKKIEQHPHNMRNMAGVMNRYISSIGNIERNLAVSGQAKNAIRNSLGGFRRNLEQKSTSINTMAERLDETAKLYKSTEKSVLAQKVNLKEMSALKPSKSVSLWEGSAGIAGTILGIKSGLEVKGNVFGASWDTGFESGVKWKDGKLKSISLIRAFAAGEVHLAEGSVKGNIGIASGEIKGSVGKVSGTGEVNVSLYKDGKLAPQIGVKGEMSAVAAEGEAKVSVGSKNNNVHGKVSGKAGVAKAYGEAAVGKITYKTESGEVKTTNGVKLEAGAEAYAGEAKASGGVNIFGIKIDVGFTGKAGGAGGSIGYTQATGCVKGKLGVGLIFGAEVELGIDWSGFKWAW